MYTDDELKKNKYFILKAMKINKKALIYADDELKKDRNFILDAL